MAINKIDWPTASTPVYTPDIETDYNNQNENLERVARGYNAVSLTNWDGTTTAPQVAAGSVIEANGSLYDITTNTAIGTSLATTGTVYLTFNDEATVSFEWEDAVPVWSDTLNGWYVSGDRFTGHLCTWDGASSFTIKSEYRNNKQDGDKITISAVGDAAITGGVVADSIDTDNSPIKMKLLTGTLDNDSATAIAHGLTYADIISVAFSAYNTTEGRFITTWGEPTYSTHAILMKVSFDTTNIHFQSNYVSSGFGSQAYRAIVFYVG